MKRPTGDSGDGFLSPLLVLGSPEPFDAVVAAAEAVLRSQVLPRALATIQRPGPTGSGKTTLAECAARYWGVNDFDMHKVKSAECDVARLRELASKMLYYGCPSRKVHPAQKAGVQMLKIRRFIPDKAGGAAIRRLASRQGAGNRRDVSSDGDPKTSGCLDGSLVNARLRYSTSGL